MLRRIVLLLLSQIRVERRRSVHFANLLLLFVCKKRLVEAGLGEPQNCPTSSNQSREEQHLGAAHNCCCSSLTNKQNFTGEWSKQKKVVRLC